MAFSVQFTSSENVLQAYLNRNCAAWSVWQGKQFMFKYEGSTVEEGQKALIELLTMLENASNAIYTLKVYEDLPRGGKIKENTPCDGSFNFKLNADNQLITNNQYSRLNNQNEIISQLNALNARLDRMEEDEEEEENETERTLGKIGSLMNNPVVMQLAQMIFGNKAGAPPQLAMSSGTIGNVPPANQDEQIMQAIAVLKQKDARIAEHLMKLATIAQTQPASFDFLIKSLDSL